MVWSVLESITVDLSNKGDNIGYFILRICAYCFFPLQGFLTFLIFLRGHRSSSRPRQRERDEGTLLSYMFRSRTRSRANTNDTVEFVPPPCNTVDEDEVPKEVVEDALASDVAKEKEFEPEQAPSPLLLQQTSSVSTGNETVFSDEGR